MNVRSLLSDIKRADSMDIDVIEINDKLCLNVAGIGARQLRCPLI